MLLQLGYKNVTKIFYETKVNSNIDIDKKLI